MALKEVTHSSKYIYLVPSRELIQRNDVSKDKLSLGFYSVVNSCQRWTAVGAHSETFPYPGHGEGTGEWESGVDEVTAHRVSITKFQPTTMNNYMSTQTRPSD